MTVRKLDDGKPKPWLAEVYPQGRDGPRKRKRFATKGEALAFEKYLTDPEPWQASQSGEQLDNRRLTDLVATWHRMHGQTLAAGERVRRSLELMAIAMGDPLAREFTAQQFATYRDQRLSGQIVFPSNNRAPVVTMATVNNEHARLLAMFNELIRLDQWQGDNPIKKLRGFKETEREMAWLTHAQIDALLAACHDSRIPDLPLVVELCLSTGARWAEVQDLTASQVTPYRLTFTRTKSKKNRSVPISPELYERIPKQGGRLFAECYNAFTSALSRAGITLPKGQRSHVLRHTFASHFMMAGGNILVLQKILGHSSIMMTMRYSHLAPDHLDEAVKLNPLAYRHP